jgi:siderophore synthetase component
MTVRYPAAAAVPFAPAEAGLAADVDGQRIDDPGTLTRLLWGDVALAAEIDNSVANLALARAARSSPDEPAAPWAGGGDGDGLALAEQSLTDGHPLHPCCRTRGEMSVADVLAYAPEHGPVFRLRRLRVPADRWFGTAPPVLYTHPWQAARIRGRHPWLEDAGETPPVRPLMSLRTVAPVGGGPHVKTAVEVQMTSAVRTVSPAAVRNGPVLSALLREVTADLPIGVLAETAAGAVIVDGEPRRELAYLTRAAPALAAGETVVPLAVFGALPGLVVADPYIWWERLCAVLFAPLVTVLERGVALEAHGQNTLLVLRDGLPGRVLYRDLGGVRVSAARLRAAGFDAPALAGDLASDDPGVLRTKLAAAAFGNSAADLVTALTRTRGTDPDRLWGILAAAVRGTGATDAAHLLQDPLPLKATTAMRLAADPLDDLWSELDNPMAAHT